MLTQIARPYAAALFDLAKSEGSVDAVETGLNELQQLSGESADFRRFLRSPVISASNIARPDAPSTSLGADRTAGKRREVDLPPTEALASSGSVAPR